MRLLHSSFLSVSFQSSDCTATTTMHEALRLCALSGIASLVAALVIGILTGWCNVGCIYAAYRFLRRQMRKRNKWDLPPVSLSRHSFRSRRSSGPPYANTNGNRIDLVEYGFNTPYVVQGTASASPEEAHDYEEVGVAADPRARPSASSPPRGAFSTFRMEGPEPRGQPSGRLPPVPPPPPASPPPAPLLPTEPPVHHAIVHSGRGCRGRARGHPDCGPGVGETSL